ncbi:MAG: YetF domain-containing protein [Bacteroidota bacterium]
MENWLVASLPLILKTAASSVLMLALALLIIRFYGLRSLAKMSSVDFASTIAIGSVLAAVIMNEGQSLLKGGIAIFCILGFQQLFSWAKRASDRIENLSENQPVFLMLGTEIIDENLTANGLTEADLMAKLREANVIDISEVKAVVFETTGDVSVLHGSDNTPLDDRILLGVKR